uniref:winged helix-turn-helix domain-containing protein n=1 Tax=Paenibacillus xylanexedens TaxID=528191 RepID=UPI003F7A7279
VVFFCKYGNRILSKCELYERVWGWEGISEENRVMVEIHGIGEGIEGEGWRGEVVVKVGGVG